MSEQTFNIDEYSIDDLKQIFDIESEYFTKDEINTALVSLLKKYSVLGEDKYMRFLKLARQKLITYLSNIDHTDDTLNEDINDSSLHQKQHLEDVPLTNTLVNRVNSVNIKDGDKHFLYTRNREQVLQQHDIPVVQGQANPVLRNINKRIVSLDTQMRTDLNASPNDVTLDLSEPLHNVLALRVLSVEIRHCWYTFDEAYGTTDFLVDSSLIQIPNGNYSESDLIAEITSSLTLAGITNIIPSYDGNTGKVTLKNTGATDYTISFYDNENPGNKKKNSNLGWLLGYRTFDSSYNINFTLGASGSPTEEVTGSSLLDVYGTKYILLELEDYNNNHFNRNFVAVNDDVESLAYPSYYTPDLSLSDPLYKAVINPDNTISWVSSGLTQSQAFTVSEIAISRQTNVNSNKISGMKTNDIISKLPVQYSKQFGILIIGYNFINKNERLYYGPVDISRMKIALYNDAGQLLNLNGQDYSITLQTDELYQY